MAEEKGSQGKKEALSKRPSALKRDLQNERKRLRNRSFRSSVNTAIRSLEHDIAQKEGSEVLQSKLRAIYSMVDKGVKRGVLKSQKAARTKSRLCANCAKA